MMVRITKKTGDKLVERQHGLFGTKDRRAGNWCLHAHVPKKGCGGCRAILFFSKPGPIQTKLGKNLRV